MGDADRSTEEAEAQQATTSTPEPTGEGGAKPKKGKKKLDRSAELLIKKRELEVQNQAAAYLKSARENQFFMICPRVKGHHAAYLKGPYSGGKIEPCDWFHILKPEDKEVWTLPYIPCQECYADGETRPWSPHIKPHMREDGSVDFTLAASRQFVIGECSRDEFESRTERFAAEFGEKVV